jgi:two-component system, chemotaxis family, sensor kinase CheA
MLTERLNHAAALLVQLAPGDLAGVIRLQKQLAELAADPAAPAVHEPLRRAAARIDDVILALASLTDIEDDLGRDIEAAMALLDADAPDHYEAAPTATGAAAKAGSAYATCDAAAAGSAPATRDAPAVGNASAASSAPAVGNAPATSIAPAVGSAAATSNVSACSAAPELFMPADTGLDLMPDFIAEALDYVEAAEAALLALEADAGDVESINVVFRAFHTIKGTAAFLGLDSISLMAHHAESLLSRVRDGELAFAGPCADLSLKAADMLRALVESLRSAVPGQPLPTPADYHEFLAILAAPDAELGRTASRLGDILVSSGKVDRATVEAIASKQGDEPLGVTLVREHAVSATDVAQALRSQRTPDGEQSTSETSVRVRTDRLDALVDMVGELVVAQSMVTADPRLRDTSCIDLTRKVSEAGKIIRELQDLSMSLRMVPLKATFQKITRLVRDLSRKSGKQVELVTDGEDTEIDRNMVDIMGDPLVHMVRNAIDHGIEAPAERAAAGKPPVGRIRLSAFHSGGGVVVELQDDGKGLDREKIVRKAVAKGLIDGDKGMGDTDIYHLVFAPGFSTADVVTDLSGRGVGMDVVRRNVESIRGRVDIQSVPGRGCTFSMRLPLTLAITDGMLVRVGAERYVVPTVSIQTSFRPEPDALSTITGRGEIVLLHGEVIPILRLHRLFASSGAEHDPARALLVVVGDASRRAALLVDELLGQQQFVAKPLGDGLGKIQGVSGGAVLGDGRVGLILDAAEIITLGERGGRPDLEPVVRNGSSR